MTMQEFDQAKAEEFAERMVDVLNSGSIALMTSIGHRTGLFDAMTGLPPSTSEQIASAAGLNERRDPGEPCRAVPALRLAADGVPRGRDLAVESLRRDHEVEVSLDRFLPRRG